MSEVVEEGSQDRAVKRQECSLGYIVAEDRLELVCGPLHMPEVRLGGDSEPLQGMNIRNELAE